MSDVKQIEVNRANIKMSEGAIEYFAVYTRLKNGTAQWHCDCRPLDHALASARELADEHACPILDTTSTGYSRTVEIRG